MAFIDEIGNKITSAGKKTTKAISDFTQVSKLKDAIGVEQNQINQAFTDMGRAYFDLYGTEAKEMPFAPICERVTMGQAKIEQMEKEIKRLQNLIECPACGVTCDKTSLFCHQCCYAFSKEAAAAPSDGEMKFCSNCGASLVSGAVFCSACGQKVPSLAPSASIAAPVRPSAPAPQTIPAPADSVFQTAPAPPVFQPLPDKPAVPLAPEPGDISCLDCGFQITPDMDFCINCGKKVEKGVPPHAEYKFLFCINCGAALEENAAFCINCGSPIQGMETELNTKAIEMQPVGEAVGGEPSEEEKEPETADGEIDSETAKTAEAAESQPESKAPAKKAKGRRKS